MTDRDLYYFFQNKFGPVEFVISKDRRTFRFAFITFQSKETAEKAFAAEEVILRTGKRLVIGKCRGKGRRPRTPPRMRFGNNFSGQNQAEDDPRMSQEQEPSKSEEQMPDMDSGSGVPRWEAEPGQMYQHLYPYQPQLAPPHLQYNSPFLWLGQGGWSGQADQFSHLPAGYYLLPSPLPHYYPQVQPSLQPVPQYDHSPAIVYDSGISDISEDVTNYQYGQY